MKTTIACVFFGVTAFLGMQYGLHGSLGHLLNGAQKKVELDDLSKNDKAKFPDDLAPLTRGKGVAAAATWDRRTHPGCVILTRTAKLHAWHGQLPAEWKSDRVHTTHMAVVLDEPRPRLQAQTGAQPDKANEIYQLDAWLVEARTGTTLAAKRFLLADNLPADPNNPIAWGAVFNWMQEQIAAQQASAKAAQSGE